ncbi:MAG: hypothetical protein AMXMBFR36_36960 [Acidobacteriota bacterium]
MVRHVPDEPWTIDRECTRFASLRLFDSGVRETRGAVSAAESPTTAPGTGRRAAALAMLVAAAIPLAVLVGSGAGHVLDPRERAWLMHGDSAQHLVAWSFYAREPWRWPPAAIERWPAPLGTTIGLADAIPLVAMPLKAIAGERAADLQYFGLWSALCLAALGATSALFLLEARGGALLAALGGGLVALSPVVWDRLTRGHPSLAAHALLVGMFVAWLRYYRDGSRRRSLIGAGVIVCISAAVHPYLLAITVALLCALVVTSAVRFGLRSQLRSAAWAILFVFIAAGIAWVVGFLGQLPTFRVGLGFDSFEADLLSLLNSAGHARWTPAIFHDDRSREGFAWLGAGVVLIGLAGVFRHLIVDAHNRDSTNARQREISTPGMRQLALATIALASAAIVPRVSLLGYPIVDLSQPLHLLSPIFHLLRANGRLIWPLHLFLALTFVLLLRRLEVRRGVVTSLLGFALVLQIMDSPDWPWDRAPGAELRPSQVAARLSSISVPTDGVLHLAAVPAYLQSGAGIHCGESGMSDAWVVPALIAAQRGWSFNSGYVARLDESQVKRACNSSKFVNIRKAARTDSLYMVSHRQARALEKVFVGVICERIGRNEQLCRLQPDSSSKHLRRPGSRR